MKFPINLKDRNSRNRLLAWLLVIACGLGSIIQLAFSLPQASTFSLFDWVELLGWGFVIPLVFSIIAALIISREPSNRVGWLLMLPALTITNPTPFAFGNFQAPPQELSLFYWLVLWVDGWSWIPVIFPIMLIPLHFPTGRPPSFRWKWVNWLSVGMWLFIATVIAFGVVIGPLNEAWRIQNPIGFIPESIAESPVFIIWSFGLAALVLGSTASLFIRYRHARVIERQQIKWLLFGTSIFAAYYLLTLFFSSDDPLRSGWENLFFVLSILAVPITIAIAILRYRLYGIDIIIRRTLQYAILTGILALVYFGSVTVLQAVFSSFLGLESTITLVLSTLAIAALFNPLRIRIQEFIDKRFYRTKYNAAQALENFAISSRDEVVIEKLANTLLNIVQKNIQPEHLQIWLKENKK